MIRSIVKNESGAKFVLVEDSAKVPDSSLFQAIVKNKSLCGCVIHLVLLESTASDFLKLLGLSEGDNLFCHEICDCAMYDKRFSLKQTLDGIYVNVEASKNNIVCFDSLTTLTRMCSVTEITFALQKLKYHKDISQAVACIHADLHKDSEYLLISKLADLHLAITNEETELLKIKYSFPFAAYRKNGNQLLYNGKHIKENGKTSVCREQFLISPDFSVTCTPWNEPKSISVQEINEQSSPQSGLTFDVNMRQREKEQKDSLVLPYTRKGQNQTFGEIKYVGDEADDFDEEDPDDDLEL